MGGGRENVSSLAEVADGGGGGDLRGHVGWEKGFVEVEGGRLPAADLSIVAIFFFFFETASVVHCEHTSALKKRR